MIYRLIILSGNRRGEHITLAKDPMTIGRAETCGIQLNDPEIALTHAEVSHTDEGLFIRDLGSMNRLLINHREVREAHPKHGDVIEVGHTRFLVQAYVQAEIQGEEDDEKSQRRKPWIIGSLLLLLLLGMIVLIPRCERMIIGPRHSPVKPTLSKFTPPPARVEIKRTLPSSSSMPPPQPATNPVVMAAELAPQKNEVPTLPPKSEPVISAPKPEPAPSPPPHQIEATPVVITKPELPETDVLPPAPPKPKPNFTSELIAASEKELIAAELILRGTKVTNNTVVIAPDLPTNIPPPVVEALVEAKDITPSPKPLPTPAPLTTGLLKITSTEINKFPETDEFREMRLLTIRLTASELQKELDPANVRVEVTFLDKDKKTGRIIPATPDGLPTTLSVQGKWLAREQKTVAASYVVPVAPTANGRTARYYGFLLRVYYSGVLQDELSQPKDAAKEIVSMTSNEEAKPSSAL